MNEEINTWFNIECLLLIRNFDFLGGYLVVTAGYCSLPGGYWSLLVVTASYRSLLFILTFSLNDISFHILISIKLMIINMTSCRAAISASSLVTKQL